MKNPETPSRSYSLDAASAPVENYVELLGTTFTQSFTSMLYNITATEQQDSFGDGPAYFLNGLTNQGYWYQVGLSWDWPYSGGGYNPGFHMQYEVFDPSGNSIYPTSGYGGSLTFSGTVNDADPIALNLYFSNGQVVMYAYDWNNSASATVTYSAEGATEFVGLQDTSGDSNGYFSGLMTEEFHVAPYYGNEINVVYDNHNTPIASAWLWADEYNSVNTSDTQFSQETSNPLSFVSDPKTPQYFATNGASEAADAYFFMTGSEGFVLLTVSSSTNDGSSAAAALTFTYYDGTGDTEAIDSSPTTFLAEYNSYWNISAPSGSSAGERYATTEVTSGIATVSEAISITFYHQFALTSSFTIKGASGNGNYSTPLLNGTSFDAPFSTPLTSTATQYWADEGSSWDVSNALTGTSSSERWLTSASSTSLLKGTVTSPIQITPIFYHQYLVSFGFSLVGGANPSFPSINYTQFDSPKVGQGGSSAWIDAGSSYSYSSVLSTVALTERWATNPEALSRIANVSSPSAPVYYHQYLVEFGYSIVGGGRNYSTPDIRYNSFGSSVLAHANVSVWVDAGSRYSYPALLEGSDGSERWTATGSNLTRSGVVNSTSNLIMTYDHQFMVNLTSSEPQGGTVNLSNGWYDSGATLNLSETANGGWQGEGWIGEGASSYSGYEPGHAVLVGSPLTESALFYPGLTVSSSSGGAVSYSYGDNGTGSVQSGSSHTIYVPSGTSVSLSATPSSFLNSFGGWSGASGASSQQIAVNVSSPTSVSASFGYGLLSIGGILAAGIGGALGGILMIRKRTAPSGAST